MDKRTLLKNYSGAVGSVFPRKIAEDRLSEVEALNMELEYGKIGISEYLTHLLPGEVESMPLYSEVYKL